MEIIFTLADTRLPICLLQVDTLPEWQAKTTMGIRSIANLSDLPPKEQVSLFILFYGDKTPIFIMTFMYVNSLHTFHLFGDASLCYELFHG